jgi:hypothetical protein
MTLKNTNTKEFTRKVWTHLKSGAYDVDENMTFAEFAAYSWERFDSEYNYEQNRRRYPQLQVRVKEWLSGLALTVACYNGDIVNVLEEWHDCQLTDKQVDRLVLNWFNFLSFKLIQLWREYDIEVTS